MEGNWKVRKPNIKKSGDFINEESDTQTDGGHK
jgi:hypothetical protein